MQTQRIRSIKSLGRKRALDFTVGHRDHNFYADGVVVSNCHASVYSKITACTLYLKVHQPLHFFWALLQMCRNESEKYEKLAVIRQEMNELGLTLLPPHFNHSELGFTIVGDKSIRFGLSMIRGMKEKAAKLELFRQKTTTTSSKFEVFQAFKNSGLDIGAVSAMIQAGCLEGYDGYVSNKGVPYSSRSRLVLEAQTWNLLKDHEKDACQLIGALPEVGWDVMRAIIHLNKVVVNEKGKQAIIDRRFDTIKRHYAPYKDIYTQNSKNERLANYFYERTVLGYSYSETISNIFADYVDGLVTVAEALMLPKNSRCRLIGFVADEPFKGKTRNGNARFKVMLSDETGQINVNAFNERIDIIKDQNGRLPIEGDLLVCNVKVMDGGSAFVEQGPDGSIIGIQSCAIFMKLGDLKDAKAKDAAKVAPPVSELTPVAATAIEEKVAA